MRHAIFYNRRKSQQKNHACAPEFYKIIGATHFLWIWRSAFAVVCMFLFKTILDVDVLGLIPFIESIAGVKVSGASNESSIRRTLYSAVVATVKDHSQFAFRVVCICEMWCLASLSLVEGLHTTYQMLPFSSWNNRSEHNHFRLMLFLDFSI